MKADTGTRGIALDPEVLASHDRRRTRIVFQTWLHKEIASGSCGRQMVAASTMITENAETTMNELARHNATRRREVESWRDERVAAHRTQALPRFTEYPLPRLKARIAHALSERWGQGPLDPQFELIDRQTFGGDITLKLPQLLRNQGPKAFIQNHVPWIVDVLQGKAFEDTIAAVRVKGMYINVTLSDRWLLASAQAVVDLGPHFGMSAVQADRIVLVDYSSPNIAKVLHAGHIRSTIIGHILSNLHETCGALVYRVNHINDFGGFGFTLEGYRRFKDRFPTDMGENERLLEIYRIRRTLERLVEPGMAFDRMDETDRELVARYFPDVSEHEELTAAYENFVAVSDARFRALESGDAEEVALWAHMVEWSLKEFEQFYDSLDIHIDLVLGESFYFQAGDDLIDECLHSGTAILYSPEIADADLTEADTMLAAGTITEAERNMRAESIRKDVGAVVVPLPGGERFVVRRADGLSIYATRDLGAIRVRRALFDPTDMTYVVGQEQRVHFSRLFKAASVIGIATPEEVRFRHVYFGFYVDARTGRKLSSRHGVANVGQLLAASVKSLPREICRPRRPHTGRAGRYRASAGCGLAGVQRPEAGRQGVCGDRHHQPRSDHRGLREIGWRLPGLHGVPGAQHSPEVRRRRTACRDDRRCGDRRAGSVSSAQDPGNTGAIGGRSRTREPDAARKSLARRCEHLQLLLHARAGHHQWRGGCDSPAVHEGGRAIVDQRPPASVTSSVRTKSDV